MAKQINEKTFELNITNELLNLSKSFIWYLDHFHWFHFPPMQYRNIISQFMKQATFFAEGLTQEEESNPLTGGYDVSINYNHPNGQEGRLMFLQYKAGIRKSYSNKSVSNFYRQTARKEGRSPEHVLFTFNDAAEGTQHSTLRNLANSAGIQSQSVIYVFPRITEKSDFKNKVGNLISNSSFVPVLEIDNQAFVQTPSISINDGVTHKYRTSYDGLTSEVNFFFFFFLYDYLIISELLSELICIQIERFANILIKQNKPELEIFLDFLPDSFNRFVEYELKQYPAKDIIFAKVNSYINSIREAYRSESQIPQAPSKYSTVVPKEGLKFKFENKYDFSEINYQIF
ncbi:MAG: hypothetical protein ACK5P4_00135 [Bacteroidota bacterium]|jgi:hypothetical protein